MKGRVITGMFGKYIYPKGYLDVGCKKEELRITPIFWVKVTGKMELLLTEICETVPEIQICRHRGKDNKGNFEM